MLEAGPNVVIAEAAGRPAPSISKSIRRQSSAVVVGVLFDRRIVGPSAVAVSFGFVPEPNAPTTPGPVAFICEKTGNVQESPRLKSSRFPAVAFPVSAVEKLV